MISPAKINLGLRVLFKRTDGYHEINSIFLKLNWGDEIDFHEAQGFDLQSQIDPSLPQLQEFLKVSEHGDLTKNILYKTYQLALERRTHRKGVQIRIKKQIPTGGGLGGGSSNAAQALKYFFPDEKKPYSEEFLGFAARIGADVPFFLMEGPSLVEGIGEKFTIIEVGKAFGLLAIPPFAIETKQAFLSLKKPLQETPYSNDWTYLSKSFFQTLQRGDWKKMNGQLENDFEPFAIASFPELGFLKDKMYQSGLDFVSMSGTGSCFYGLSSEECQIAKSIQLLKESFGTFKFVPFQI